MTQDKALTIGAIGFAVFAMVYIRKQAGGAIATQPGAQARNAGLTFFNDMQAQQAVDLYVQNSGIFKTINQPAVGIYGTGILQ